MKKIRMSKRAWGFTVLGITAYFYFMLVNVPASVVYDYALAPLDKRKNVNLQGLRGTVWQGEAAQARIASINMGKLNWDLNLLSLFTGKVGLELATRGKDSQITGHAKAGLDQTLYLDDLRGKVPASMLMPLFYGFPIAIAGKISADITHAEIQKGKRIDVEGKMVWHAAALTAPQPVELGDLFVAFRPEKGGTKLLLSDQGGPLTLDGTIQVKHNGQYKANIYLGTRDDKQPALSNGLKMMGRTNPDGKILFSRTGRLRNW